MRQVTARFIWDQSIAWLKAHLWRVVLTSAIAFVVGFLLNVWIMGFRYDGYRLNGPDGLATAEGNMVTGGLFFGILSMVIVGIVSYGFGVGWKQFFTDIRAVPGSIADLVRQGQAQAWSLILWGAGMAMVIGAIVAPSRPRSLTSAGGRRATR